MTPPNQAIEEIKAILKKHDLAGLVIVQSPAEAAFLREVSPSWSCARLEPAKDGYFLRILSKREDYPSLELQRQSVEATTGMIFAFMNWCDETSKNMKMVAGMLGRHFDIQHWERPE